MIPPVEFKMRHLFRVHLNPHLLYDEARPERRCRGCRGGADHRETNSYIFPRFSELAASESSKFLVLTGPTASGKTELGVELAERLNAEIISMDSMAVY